MLASVRSGGGRCRRLLSFAVVFLFLLAILFSQSSVLSGIRKRGAFSAAVWGQTKLNRASFLKIWSPIVAADRGKRETTGITSHSLAPAWAAACNSDLPNCILIRISLLLQGSVGCSPHLWPGPQGGHRSPGLREGFRLPPGCAANSLEALWRGNSGTAHQQEAKKSFSSAAMGPVHWGGLPKGVPPAWVGLGGVPPGAPRDLSGPDYSLQPQRPLAHMLKGATAGLVCS